MLLLFIHTVAYTAATQHGSGQRRTSPVQDWVLKCWRHSKQMVYNVQCYTGEEGPKDRCLGRCCGSVCWRHFSQWLVP